MVSSGQFKHLMKAVTLAISALYFCVVCVVAVKAETNVAGSRSDADSDRATSQTVIPSGSATRTPGSSSIMAPAASPGTSSSPAVPSAANHSTSLSSINPTPGQRITVANRFNLMLPQETILPNGLRVLILEDHTFPVVSCLVWYRVGSRNELPGTTGLSHLVEHLLFKNIGTFKKNQLATTIVSNGGQFNGFTSEDFTAFYTTLPANKYELAVHGEEERMHGAKFTKADVTAEVNNLSRELDEQIKDPVGLLNREVHATAYEQHPYRNPPSGWRHDLERLSYEDARWYYERYYHPDNATIVLVGDLKAATALATVKKYFALVPKAPHSFPAPRVLERFPVAEKRVLMKSPSKKEAVVVAYHAPAASDPDAPVMTILEKLLNSQMSGRLRKQLVEAKFCSSAQAVYELKRDPSLFTINMVALAGTSPAKVLEVTDGLIAQLRNQMVSDAELTKAKRQAEFEYFNEADGPFRTGFQLGVFESLLNWQADYAWPDKLRKVDAADIRRLANRYLLNEARVVGQLMSPPAPITAPTPKTTLPGTTGQIETNDRYIASSSLANWMQRAHYKKDDSLFFPVYISEAPKAPSSQNAQAASENIVPTKAATTNSPNSVPEHAIEPVTTGVVAPKAIVSPATVTSAGQQSIVPASGVTLKTTRAGINVIVIESHLNPLVEILGSIKAGSVFDPPDKMGLSSLLGTLLNCGSTRYSRQQMISDQDDMGLPPQAMLHFESGLNEITVHTRCLSPDLSAQLSRLASSIKDPRFTDADLEKARQDLLNSIPQSDDAITSKAQRALLKSLVVTGSKFVPPDPSEKAKSIANLNLGDVHDFYSNYVAPKSFTLVIAGDVNANQVIGVVEHAFDGWNFAKPIIRFPSLAAELGAHERHGIKSSIPIMDKGTERAHGLVCLGRIVPLKSNESEDTLWSNLLLADCALTNHPMFSHINHRLETEPGLSGSLSSTFLTSHIKTYPDASIWSLQLPIESANESNAVQAIQTELTKFTQSGLTQEELIESKRYVLGCILVKQMANLDALCRASLESFDQRNELSPLGKTSASIRSATLETVNQFVANNFKPDQAAVVIVGNKQLIRQVHPTTKRETASQDTGERQ